MNQPKIVLAFLLAGVFAGCGGEPPPPTSNDAAVADATPIVDASVPTDANTPVNDAPPSSDRPGACMTRFDDVGRHFICINGVEACRPSISSDDRRVTCEDQNLCRPSWVDPYCRGARACACGEMTESQMSDVCRDDMGCATVVRSMAATSLATCEPEHNRCSLNLPRDVEYTPFFLEGTRLLTVFRQFVWSERLSNGTFRRIGAFIDMGESPYGDHGFVQVRMFSGAADCGGHFCYFRRSEPLRRAVTSFEIEFTDHCHFLVRRFPPGAEQPSETQEYAAGPCWDP